METFKVFLKGSLKVHLRSGKISKGKHRYTAFEAKKNEYLEQLSPSRALKNYLVISDTEKKLQELILGSSP